MKTKKIYFGTRPNGVPLVTTADADEYYTVIDEKELNPRLDCVNHSPDGFEWGYSGSGPAQLAFAILADLIDVKFARKHYQDFKFRVIQNLPHDDFTLTCQEITDLYQIDRVE